MLPGDVDLNGQRLLLSITTPPIVRFCNTRWRLGDMRRWCCQWSTRAEISHRCVRMHLTTLPLDMQMPGMDGLELPGESGRSGPGLPLVMLTSIPTGPRGQRRRHRRLSHKPCGSLTSSTASPGQGHRRRQLVPRHKSHNLDRPLSFGSGKAQISRGSWLLRTTDKSESCGAPPGEIRISRRCRSQWE
jgi:hypothetical protein